MAINRYTKALIKRRNMLLSLTLEQKQEIINIYIKAGKDVVKRLETAKPKSLTERYLKEMKKAIDEYEKKLQIDLDKSIRKYMQKAADLGVDASKAYFEDMDIPLEIKKSFNSMFTNVSDDVVKLLVQGGYYEDGKTLSTRIWNISKSSGKEIDTIIKVAIAEQKSTNDLARELEQHIKTGVGRPQKTILRGISKDISYQAVRLARTSIGHCFVESSVESDMDNPFNIGTKWNLSSQHVPRLAKFGKTRDICDDYSEQNEYNLGPGVYPAKSYPIGHPNCLCYPTSVNVDINIASDEIVKWIKGGKNKKLDNWALRNGFDIDVS